MRMPRLVVVVMAVVLAVSPLHAVNVTHIKPVSGRTITPITFNENQCFDNMWEQSCRWWWPDTCPDEPISRKLYNPKYQYTVLIPFLAFQVDCTATCAATCVYPPPDIEIEEGCPLILNLGKGNLELTGLADGVNFDLNGDGTAERLSWTAAGTDNAFLALDINADGVISSGQELFGNYSVQRSGAEPPNGFAALAFWDEPAQGGNGDGAVSKLDAIWPSLRLWQDDSHDGVSQTFELRTLDDAGVVSISTDHKESRAKDRHGNELRYRGTFTVQTVHGERDEKVIDVFFLHE